MRKETGELHKYKDYEEYKKVQIKGNIDKLDAVFVREQDIIHISKYIKKNIGKPEFGLCHGTRQGKEQEWFKRELECEVIGTEISPTAQDYPDTIEWDFHEVKKEWIEQTDFIYSNSFDHSYKPEECLDIWMSCLREGGLLILEWTKSHQNISELDPYGGTIEEYKELIKKKYKIKEIITPKGIINRLVRKTTYIIVEK